MSLLMIRSIPVYVVSWLPMELDLFLFIDDMTAEKSSKKDTESSAHIQPNASSLNGQCLRVLMDNNLKNTQKQPITVFKAKKVECSPSQSAFYLLKTIYS